MQLFIIITAALYQFVILEAQYQSKLNFELLEDGCPDNTIKERELMGIYSWLVLESSIFYFNLAQLFVFIILSMIIPERIFGTQRVTKIIQAIKELEEKDKYRESDEKTINVVFTDNTSENNMRCL